MWWHKIEHVDDGDDRIWISMPMSDCVIIAILLIAVGKYLL